MSNESIVRRLSFPDRCLTAWILLAMGTGAGSFYVFPGVVSFLNRLRLREHKGWRWAWTRGVAAQRQANDR